MVAWILQNYYKTLQNSIQYDQLIQLPHVKELTFIDFKCTLLKNLVLHAIYILICTLLHDLIG
jgi:hypothetical protein